MITLNLSLSSFRLTALAPSSTGPATLPLPRTTFPSNTQLLLTTTTHRLDSVHSPISPRPSSDTLVFPPSWSVQWTESLPDRLALRAAALHVRAIRPPSQRIPSAFSCAVRASHRVLGSLTIDLHTLATSTVCHSLRLRAPDGSTSHLSLSFDAVVDHPASFALGITDLSLPLPRLESPPPQAVFLTAHSSLTEHHVSSDVHPISHVLPSVDPLKIEWPSMPPLPIRASSLLSLAHSTITFRLHTTSTEDTPTRQLASVDIPLHSVWGALLHPRTPFSHTTPITPTTTTLSISFTTISPSSPPLGQPVGGVTTDTAVTGPAPVIFGSPIANLSRLPREASLPTGWLRLVDTFGHRFFRNVTTAVDVWTPPAAQSVTDAVAADTASALLHGLQRVRGCLYLDSLTNANVWVHPDATVVPIPPEQPLDMPLPVDTFSPMEPDDVPDGPPSAATTFSLSTLDAAEVHPASLARLFTLPHPTDGNRTTAPRARIVELKWTLLPRASNLLATASEGHTLTAIGDAHSLLHFGGAVGNARTRSNALHRLDADTLCWTRVDANGVPPEPRTGHAAVALGSDRSRLLVFGGTCTQGRLNDVHVLHTGNDTWSPVRYTGTPPGVRVRHGMTVTDDGSIALVFGGRSLYRWMGGKYYDSQYVHAFHAERAQWFQMEPRGSGPRPAPRSGCAVQFLNGRLMVVHGGYEDGKQYFDDTFLFDIASCSWVQPPYPDEPTRPSGREGHASTVVDGDAMVVFGGDGRSTMASDVHLFEGGSLRWAERPTTVGRGPGRNVGAAMATLADGRMVFVGGEDGFGMLRQTYSISVSHRSTIGEGGYRELAKERGPDAKTCVVCLDAEVTTMFMWCGHSVCCIPCAQLVSRVCPICRKEVSKVVYSTFG